MFRIAIGLTMLCLLAGSCDEWKAIDHIETDMDQPEEYEAMGTEKEDGQNYISLAKVCFVRDTLISRSMVHITLRDGTSKWEFGADDLNSAPYWSTSEVQTLMDGVLTMDFTIRAADGAIVSAGRMQWPLESNRRLSIYISRDDHARKGWGFSGSKSFPIVNSTYKANERDAIFVTWGGDSISHPVRY